LFPESELLTIEHNPPVFRERIPSPAFAEMGPNYIKFVDYVDKIIGDFWGCFGFKICCSFSKRGQLKEGCSTRKSNTNFVLFNYFPV